MPSTSGGRVIRPPFAFTGAVAMVFSVAAVQKKQRSGDDALSSRNDLPRQLFMQEQNSEDNFQGHAQFVNRGDLGDITLQEGFPFLQTANPAEVSSLAGHFCCLYLTMSFILVTFSASRF